MEAVTVNPRQIADALGVDLYDLARTMRKWAAEELGLAAADIAEDRFVDQKDLARFDARVERARLHVEGVVACDIALSEDNPLNEDELSDD